MSDSGAFVDDVDACLLVFGNYRSSEARSGRFSDFDAFLDSNRELSFPFVQSIGDHSHHFGIVHIRRRID